ncbi:hypothetical protein [Planktothrix agardhii]|uniref:hypothetical protein n=1 Tax=Planktothrix agardhii TaxID=1160 RepID=UPI002876B7EC|nr:hypothetical protein [Planktothrix agardhii]MDS1346130.1 hypothetical protein [Planktothrix agardhii NRERC-751]
MTETNTQDVLYFLEQIIPDTPEMQLIERQELFRLTLTQVMRNLRKKLGLTQQDINKMPLNRIKLPVG